MQADLIIEQLLDEEEGSGIFMKQLDNGRKVYTAKCPVCGVLHGGFRSQGEAEANKKCRQHYRSEIEKTRKEVEKVDEPEKPKDLFKNPNRKEVMGEAQDDDVDWKDVTDVGPDFIAYDIFDGSEYFPVTRDGFIGRQEGQERSISGDWKVQGMTFHHNSSHGVQWPELKSLLSTKGKISGYLWDLDHGSTRRWGKKVTISKRGVAESAEDEELDIESILAGRDVLSGEVDKLVCEQSWIGQELWHRHESYADGTPIRVVVSGLCETHKTDEFSLPVKFGLFQTLYITERNAGDYSTVQPNPGGRFGVRPNPPGRRKRSKGRSRFRTTLDAVLD